VATTLAVTPQWITTVDPTGNLQLSAGNSVSFLYHVTEKKWFKIG